MHEVSLAESWGLLPSDVLAGLDNELKSAIVRSVIMDAKHARIQAWVALLLAFLTIPSLIILSWHFVDKGAATQGAAVITSGAVGLVGLFLGARVTSNRTRRNQPSVPEGSVRTIATKVTPSKSSRVAPAKTTPSKTPPSRTP